MNKQKIPTLGLEKSLLQADNVSKINSEFEAENFSEEKLDQEAKINEHVRTEGAKTTIHWGNIVLIVALYAMAVGSVGTLGWHLISPKTWHFLNDNQLAVLENLLFSALATSFAKEFLKKHN